MSVERLYVPIETRGLSIESRNEQPVLVGYAAVFYRDNEPGTEFRFQIQTNRGKRVEIRERVLPGAFDKVLKQEDSVGLFNHRSDNILGRKSNNTLRMVVDDVGLRYEIDLPDTSHGTDVAKLVKRGDIKGSSFGFRAGKQKFENRGDYITRSHFQLDRLSDVGPVTYAAYESTTTALRSSGGIGGLSKGELEQLARQVGCDEAEEVRTRYRLMEIQNRG